jgi:hypothetical protein
MLIAFNFVTLSSGMHFICAITLIFFSHFSFAQFSRLSRYERNWSLLHPIAAMKVKQITRKCEVLHRHSGVNNSLDSFPSGGKNDAFRHVFYMAAYAQKIRTKKLRKLGEAHEKGNYRQFLRSKLEEGEQPDSLSSVMDIKNNEIGLAIGCNFRKLTLLELERMVVYEINNGRALIMKRNSKGQYLDCEGKEIDMLHYRNKWQVPKCLVASNYIPND